MSVAGYDSLMEPGKVAARLLEVTDWACANGVALAIVACSEGEILVLKHIGCAKLADEDNGPVVRIAAAMVDAAVGLVAERLAFPGRGKDPS